MKIKELQRDTRNLDNPDDYYDSELGKWITNTFKLIKKFPNFKNYELRYYLNPNTQRHMLIAFDKSLPIAMISVINTEIGNNLKQIYLSKVKKSYQGNGLGVGMYTSLANELGGILSDYTLTQAGQNIWKSLYRNPNINVMKYDLYKRNALKIENEEELNKLFGKKSYLLLATPI